MLKNDKIMIEEIVYVYRITGNERGSHTEYNLSGVRHCQLLYKLSGEARVTFGGKTVEEREGDVRFLPAGTDFEQAPEYSARVVERGECVNIAFITGSPLPREIVVKDFSKQPALKEAFEKIERLWYYKRDGYYHKCMSLLYDILAKISVSESDYLSSSSYRIIEPAIDYIEGHFREKSIDCDYLAALSGVSHTYMTKIFKKHFGISPNAYITHKKISYAKDLLKTREYTAAEVAETSGFSSPYYFSRVFKKSVGISPTQYAASLIK